MPVSINQDLPDNHFLARGSFQAVKGKRQQMIAAACYKSHFVCARI